MVKIEDIRKRIRKLSDEEKVEFLKKQLDDVEDARSRKIILKLIDEIEEENLDDLVDDAQEGEDVKLTKQQVPEVKVEVPENVEQGSLDINSSLDNLPRLEYREAKEESGYGATIEDTDRYEISEEYLIGKMREVQREDAVVSARRFHIDTLDIGGQIEKYKEVESRESVMPESKMNIEKYVVDEKPSFDIHDIIERDREGRKYKVKFVEGK